MNASEREAVKRRFGERAAFDVQMDTLTSWRVGGPADCVLSPTDAIELSETVRFLSEKRIPYVVIGGGFNVLVRDKGIREAVVSLSRGFGDLRIDRHQGEAPRIYAESGVSIHRLVKTSCDEGISGLEFLAGTPGSVGGAVAMNAGIRGREVKDAVIEITVVSPEGTIETLRRRSLDFYYRGLRLRPGTVIVSALFDGKPNKPERINERINTILKRRRETQPIQLPSAGSVFKNPKDDFAGRLIEMAGLKGARIGDAEISRLHANFIVNLGHASAADILALMRLAEEQVLEKTGIRLSPEVRIMGEE